MTMFNRLIALVVLGLAACGGGSGAKPQGSLSVAVSIDKSSAMAGDVTQIVLLLERDDGFSRTLVLESATDGKWIGRFENIPLGPGYRISGTASDGTNSLYTGSYGYFDVTEGMPAVVIVMQEANPPNPYYSNPPRINGIWLSSSSVVSGGTLEFDVEASSRDEGMLSYAWSTEDGSGSFSDPHSWSTSWTAPLSTTTITKTIIITVTNEQGASTTFSFDISITGAVGVPVEVQFNNWPQVMDMELSATQVDLGTQVTLTVLATDADNDSLFYSYGTDGMCMGTFEPTAQDNVMTFTPFEAFLNNTCTLRVQVDDGRGGTGSGTIGLNIGLPGTYEQPY
jgi:hypothetical protein